MTAHTVIGLPSVRPHEATTATLGSAGAAVTAVLLLVVPNGLAGVVEARGVAAVAGILTLLCSLATPARFRVVAGVYGVIGTVGSLAQIRLGVSGWRVLAFDIAAVACYVSAIMAVRTHLWRRLTVPGAMARTGAALLAGALLLRLIPRLDGTYALANGRLPVPVVGSVQIGEFTRLMIVACTALLAHDAGLILLARVRGVESRVLAVVGALLLAGNLALLARVDRGPAVITAAACGVVLLNVLGPVRWTPATRRAVRIGLLLSGGFLVFLTVSSTVVLGRFLAVFVPSGQAAYALNAMRSGGLIGGGFGSSPFVNSIEVPGSDDLPAVIGADLGSLALCAIVLACYFALTRLLAVAMASRTAATAVSLGLVTALTIQTAWCVLAVLGLAPLTGLSVPGLTITGSGVVPTALALGFTTALLAENDPAAQAPLRLVRSRTALGFMRPVLGATVLACLALTLIRPIITTRDEILLPRGRVLTALGTPIAVTADGRRFYPDGVLYADLGVLEQASVAEYGIEATAGRLLTSGGRPSGSLLTNILHPANPRPADVVTTVDPGLQTAAQVALAGKQGAVVVLDSSTGAARALYSTGEPDPGRPPAGPLPSRSRLTRYPLGGLFEVVTGTAALIYQVSPAHAPASSLVVPDGATVHNQNGVACPDPSIITMLSESCNTTAAYLGMQLGDQRLQYVAQTYFGADRSLPYDGGAAPGLATGLTGSTQPGALAYTAFGLADVRASALDVAVVGAAEAHALTSTGQPPAPRLIEGVCRRATFRAVTGTITVGQALPRDAAEQIYLGMRSAAEHGAAAGFAGSEHEIAVKTSTVEEGIINGAAQSDSWILALVDKRWAVAVHIHNSGNADPSMAQVVAEAVIAAIPKKESVKPCG
jgi:cell division protein FtsW (lipid II flippase)